jgi:hypothetical protein
MKDVVIKYLLIGEPEWKEFELKPEDFFDPLGENEIYSVFDSVEKHFLEPRNYLKEQQENVLMLKISILDQVGNKSENKYTYWNRGQNHIKETLEFRLGVLSYRTIIFSVNVDDQNQKSLVFRIEDIDGQLVPITQVIEHNNVIVTFDLSAFDHVRGLSNS